MRRTAFLLSVTWLLLLLTAPALAAPQPERRVALIIGNGAYKAGPLKNPPNDARDMAATLKSVGFEVILRENASLRQMNEAIDQFWGSLKRGGVGLFFFAGHGVQVAGENFLVPVDARIALEKDVQYECVNAGKVLGRMEDAGNGLNIVILDACRNNPFARSFRSESRGLAKMDAPTGSLVAFATAPGDVAADGEGKNGLYTSHLLRHLRTPGLTIENVLKQTRIGVAADSAKMGRKQTPWESSSLMGDFYFAGGSGQAAALLPAAQPAPVIQTASLPPAGPPSGASTGSGRFDRPSAQQAPAAGQPRAWLGLKMANTTPEAAKSVGLSKAEGVLVQEVLAGSPAEAVNLKAGDVILAVGGEPLASADALKNRVASSSPGTMLLLRLWRQREAREVAAILAAPPSGQASGSAVADLTQDPLLGQFFGAPQGAAAPQPAASKADAVKAARMEQLNASLSGRRRVAEEAPPASAGQELAGLIVRLIYTDDMRSPAEQVQDRLKEQGMQVEMIAFKKNDSYRGHIGKLYAATGYEDAAQRVAEIVRSYTPITITPGGSMSNAQQKFNLWIAR